MKALRVLLYRLFYTAEGHLDLTWPILLVVLALAAVGIAAGISGRELPNAVWAFLAGAFSSALIAAVPIGKARILAGATSPGAIAEAVAKATALASTGVKAPSLADRAAAEAEPEPDA